MDERAKWENRYQQSREFFYGREPSAFLVRSLELLPGPGRCLDIGGGEGRNAVFLASRGWHVTMVDVAAAGVARARAAARQRGVPVAMAVGDTAALPLAIAPSSLDLVLVVNYHDRDVVGAAGGWLRPNGALLVEGFAGEQLGRSSGGPSDPAHLWHANELLELAAGLRVVWYEDRLVVGDDNPRHRGEKWVVRMVARRQP
ncbi:MAG: methyltransferase domain-containing protein [Acidobacteriota bacterium]